MIRSPSRWRSIIQVIPCNYRHISRRHKGSAPVKPGLRSSETPHKLQVLVGQFQRGIDPVFHDFLQLIKLERIDPAARTVNADMAGMARIILADIIAYRLFPFARFGDHMDQAHIVHFLGAIHLAPQDHSFSMNMADRSEEHTSELQSLMRISYAAFCL